MAYRGVPPPGHQVKFSPFRWHLCLVLAPLLTACTGVEYYSQAIQGHFEVMGKAQPIEQILNDPATDSKLRDRLRLVQEIRAFAVEGLHLHGGYGFMAEYEISKLIRDAQIIDIYEGVREVQNMIIGRELI